MPRSIVETPLANAFLAQGRVTWRVEGQPLLTTQAVDWPGIVVEAGKNNIAEVDEVALHQHYFSLNVDHRPYYYEIKGPYGFRRVKVPPKALARSCAIQNVRAWPRCKYPVGEGASRPRYGTAGAEFKAEG